MLAIGTLAIHNRYGAEQENQGADNIDVCGATINEDLPPGYTNPELLESNGFFEPMVSCH